MFKQVMKYCENGRFVNFIRVCQQMEGGGGVGANVGGGGEVFM